MRKVSIAAVALLLAIALYFTLTWGVDAFHVLTSSTYGLEDVWRSQFVFGIGSHFKLSPTALMQLAAFFGVMKLAVAAFCAIHIIDRLRSLAGGHVKSDIIEGAFILVVGVSIAAAAPAVWSNNIELVREQVVQLVLAALGTALCIAERSYHERVALDEAEAAMPQAAGWFSPWR